MVHVLFEILLHILKDEGEGAIGVDNVVQSDDVGVFEVFQQRDLSDGRAGRSFLVLQPYLLQSHQHPCDAAGRKDKQSLNFGTENSLGIYRDTDMYYYILVSFLCTSKPFFHTPKYTDRKLILPYV